MTKDEKAGKAAQRDRFIEAARQPGADEAAFKAKLAQIARQKPNGDVPEPPKDDIP